MSDNADGTITPYRLTEAELRAIRIEDAGKALRTVRELAGQGVSDDDLAPLVPLLLDALRAAPDPDLALAGFARWFGAVGSPYAYLQSLVRHPVALELFCQVAGSSGWFADLLARRPETFEVIANPGVRGGTKTAATMRRELSSLVNACRLPELKRDALRLWKARETLRIGVRDLVGLSDLPAVVREFSNLADACAQTALDIARASHPLAPDAPQPPFAVFALGKLGGQELNYSSDIDLMFVSGDDAPAQVVLESGRIVEAGVYLTRLGETLIKALAEETANGHVFRVDMRLRPEGRFGPLVRSLSSCRAYYENWAESWERQALLKVRFVAGDRALGEAFADFCAKYAYRKTISPEFLEDIRDNKRRIERKCELEGQTLLNIKTGLGGIRDAEFIVQKLQLEYGGARAFLRTPNTLSAIRRLHHAALLSDSEAAEIADDYAFLRTLEHRLQLSRGFQTQTLPSPDDAPERRSLARRMGFSDAPAFEAALERRRNRLRAHLNRLFYGDATEAASLSEGEWSELGVLLDNPDSPAAQERLTRLLDSTGFRDAPAALRALQLPMRGNEFGGMPPDTPAEFRKIAPRLVALLARSPDPDAGLAGIEALATAVPNRAQLYASFDDSPQVMERLVRLSAAAPPLVKTLCRRLEWLESLVSPDEEDEPETFADATKRLRAEIASRTRGSAGMGAKLEAIARIHQREKMRIGAREIWDEADAPAVMSALTALACAMFSALLDLCAAPIVAASPNPEFATEALRRVAVIGLGKLGGAELGYGSDWDVVFVYSERRGEAKRADSFGSGAERFRLVNGLVERVLAAGKELGARGADIDLDLRLRPWGKKGATAVSLRSLAAYYRTTGETWERQAALKAGFVAGDSDAGRRGVRILHAASYGHGLSEEEDAAIRAMKRRVETERLKSEERSTDLKLGFGGLTDIEWIVQRLQMRHGPTHPSLRVPNTLRALSALASAHLLEHAEADVLMAAYCLLTRLRNALWLASGRSQDVFPADAAHRRALARASGYMDDAEAPAETRLWEDAQAYMTEVRRIFHLRFQEDATL